MALVIEDGSGLNNAQSYASVEALKEFAKRRGLTVPQGNSECEALLTLAWDAMLGLDYVGVRATKEQAGDFPRDGVEIDGFRYGRTELPTQLSDTQCALAIEAQKTDLLPTLPANSSGAVVEKSVGPITIRYAESGRSTNRPIVEKARAYLRKLLRNGGGVFVSVSRA